MREKSTKIEQGYREKVLAKCWTYLDDNFHKFGDTTKTKVALALCTKNLPQEIVGDGIASNNITQVFTGADEGRARAVRESIRQALNEAGPA